MEISVSLYTCDKCNRLCHSFDGKTFRLRHGKNCHYSTLTDVGFWK